MLFVYVHSNGFAENTKDYEIKMYFAPIWKRKGQLQKVFHINLVIWNVKIVKQGHNKQLSLSGLSERNEVLK